MSLRKAVFVAGGVWLGSAALVIGCSAEPTGVGRASVVGGAGVAWSRSPPAGLEPWQVPEFVAITFDDNFTSGLGDVKGGMTWVTTFMKPLSNPPGRGEAGTFDGTLVRTSFYFTSLYIDGDMLNQRAWRTAYEDGHEPADHTRLHGMGGAFTVAQWIDEIQACKVALMDPVNGIGAMASDVIGFRAPYLTYTANSFAALVSQSFLYDTSIQGCYDDLEDGTNCAWPYTLDEGSPDAVVLARKFGGAPIDSYPSFWEAPLSALVVPPDDVADVYQFTPGLRSRIAAIGLAAMFYEPATAKIQPVDVTLFVNAQMTSGEVTATLEYNLDRHIGGNRSPFVLVAHSHVYGSNFTVPLNAPDYVDRQQAIEKFIVYALSKPVVRARPVRDILAWMQTPVALADAVRPEAGPDAPPEGSTSDVGANGGGGTLVTEGGVASPPRGASGSNPSNASASSGSKGRCACRLSASRRGAAGSLFSRSCPPFRSSRGGVPDERDGADFAPDCDALTRSP